jgi:hypothetical protein
VRIKLGTLHPEWLKSFVAVQGELQHRDLVAVIDQYRHHPTPADNTPTGRETSILAALRNGV